MYEQYERATQLAEALHVYQNDRLQIIPKLQRASKAVLADDAVTALPILNDVLTNLEILKKDLPEGRDSNLKLEWLEIYVEIFQKFAVIALIGFFLIKLVLFLNPETLFSKLSVQAVMAFVLGAVGCLFSLFDLAKYGESAWGFLDLQVVLTGAVALIGGWVAALIAGLIGIAFRLSFHQRILSYPFIVAAAALAGGAGSIFTPLRNAKRQSLAVGLLIGLLHSLFIYYPARQWMQPSAFAFSIGFLTLIEGAAIFIFYAVIDGVLGEQDSRRTEAELLKTRLLFLQSQMSPHFVFNALNTISAICANEKAFQAQRLILRLSDYLRNMLRREQELITVKEEMDYVDAYLELEKARYQERLQIKKSFEISEKIWGYKIPLLTIQPLIENAVKHGLSKKERGGTIEIRFTEEKDDFVIRIKDDGIGFSEPVTITKNGEGAGIGVRNIRERLRRLYGKSANLTLEGSLGGGAEATIKIPMSKMREKL